MYPPRRRERVAVRVLCLGNPLLADDAFGFAVAQALREPLRADAEVVENAAGGFGVLDDLLDVDHLLVVDTVRSGMARPGTLYLVQENDVRGAPGRSPHYVGLCEMLALARTLRLHVPQEVAILAVEGADCTTVGGRMHPAVRAAVPAAARQAGEIVRAWRRRQA